MKSYNQSMGQYYKSKGIDVHTWTTVNPYEYNHTKQKIINVQIDGTFTRSSGSVWLPFKWQPDMTVTVDWDVDPYPNEKIPMKTEGCCMDEKAYQNHISHYQHHQAVVVVPVYNKEDLCMIAAHFLPDNRAGLAVSCSGDDIKIYHL